ncbi:DUF6573 family protein [Nocardia asteroides]|uniref:DUF6573 family protein n=1 Tax=Nocardia asteroides TaxID=1824 RepID=UPI001E45B787|nr:DUF6573 family protein [Nocardia asteroides]UGT58836.1 hypothetical protein LTT85_33330 [Nocardia asteroides]
MPETYDLRSIFGDPIHIYTRAQALRDGALHDAGELATEAGFKYPVALTAAAWADTVAWDYDDASQDETGRLWDVLYMGANAIRRAVARGANSGPLAYTLLRVTAPGQQPTLTSLVITLGPGDDSEPVFTLDSPEQ